MSGWINEIATIEKTEKLEGTNNLSIYTVLGYPVVDKTGAYKVGDLCTYIGIDTILPDISEYHFISPKSFEQYEEDGKIKSRVVGYKYAIGSVPESKRIVKSKRFFGQYSQGILLSPLNNFNIGDSVVEVLGLKKWEEEEEDNIPNANKGGANMAAPPKVWSIPYYDIDGLRKYVSCLQQNEEIALTEKVHGSNFSACYDGEKLWVKSRNYYKKMDEDDPWWDIALRYKLEEKLSKYPFHVFFGEMYGHVKNFRYDCEIVNGKMESKIRFFDIWDVKKMRYLDYDPFVAMVKEVGLDLMPELYRGVWKSKEEMYPYSEGLTLLGGKHVKEGFVLRTVKERYEPRLDSRMIVKLVGEGYNLKK